QFGLLPGQVSARSHSPAAARQVKVDDWKPAAGVALRLPVQVSATSHPPDVAARQMVPPFPGLWTQSGLPTVPLHWSVVHTLPSSVQAVPDAFTVSFEQVELEPVQSSALSHSLAAARHVVPALPGACWQMLLMPLQRSVVQTLPSSVQAVPFVLNVHVVVQHEPGVPLFMPSSHDSPPLRLPFPQVGAACSWPASTVRRPTKAKARMRGLESFVRVARRAAGCPSR